METTGMLLAFFVGLFGGMIFVVLLIIAIAMKFSKITVGKGDE